MNVKLELLLKINLTIQQLKTKKYDLRETFPITWIFF